MKYRVMATFGSNAGKPFEEINMILNEIFAAASALGIHYWKRQGRVQKNEKEFQQHLEQMQKYEAVFWFMGEEKDEIAPRVQNAVEKIESIAREASMMKTSGFRRKYSKNKKGDSKAKTGP
jgi:hypothetical protein